MQAIDVLPTAPCERFEECGPADVIENRFPIQWILEITKRFVVRVRRRLVRWKQYRPRNRHADLGRERVVEEFFVCAPPERIIHDRRAGQRGIFEPGPIKRNVLRDSIDHEVVTAWLALDHLVYPDKFRDDVLAAGFLIHPLDKRRRKAVLLAKKNSNFFHHLFSVIPSAAKRSRGIPQSNR